MKKQVILAVLFVTIASVLSAQNATISQLWSDFEKARISDQPQKELEILAQIKKQASLERSSWDYYKACENERDVRSSVNWKDRENATNDFSRNVFTFKSAIASFYLVRGQMPADSLLSYIGRNEQELKKGHNKEFYTNDAILNYTPIWKVLSQIIENDYDYALWYVFLRTSDVNALNGCVRKDYPFDALAEFHRINALNDNTRDDKLNEFSLKYDGKAAGVLAEDLMVKIRFDELVSDGGNSDQFKDILNDCKFLENKKSKFSGLEKDIAFVKTYSSSLIKELNSNDIYCTVKDDTLRLILRNLPSARTTISKNGTAVLSFNTKNTAGSFYAPDTLMVFLPSKLDDGTYDIECSNGETKYDTVWDKYTLSVAFCRSAEGYRAFVTDYYTGEPIKGYEQGFQPVQDGEFQAKIKEKGRTRLSKKLNGSIYYANYKPTEEKYSCVICDRKVFKPQETVHFKAYHSPGGEVRAILRNPSFEIVDSVSLVIGEYGTAAGEFLLSKQKKNGYYHIDITQNDETVASTDILVEEFKLPSFKVSIDKIDRVFLAGDTATITGTILSYAGHNLSDAAKTYTVRKSGQDCFSGKVVTDAEGRFCIDIPTEGEKSYSISVKVVDRTGEVCEAKSYFNTYKSRHSVSILNADQGSADNYSFHIVSADAAKIEFRHCKHPVQKVEYSLEENGETIISGSAEAYTETNIPLPHPGLFTLKSSFCGVLTETSILHVTDTDNIAPKGVNCFFRELWDDELAIQTGSDNENHWTLAEIFSPDNKLLASKILKGTGIIRFEWKTEYPDVIALKAVSFCKGESYYHSMVRARNVRSMALPLNVSRFTDKTAPASTGLITIETNPETECAISIYDKSADAIYNNKWSPFQPFVARPSTVNYRALAGTNGMAGRYKLMKASNTAMVMDDLEASGAKVGGMPEINLRSDFESTLLWEPMLHSDSNGQIPVSFQTKDGTGTFVVQMFAHDKDFNNAVLAKEMTVSLPLEIAVREPAFLYVGDTYVFRANIYNSMRNEVTGTCTVSVDGTAASGRKEITVPAGGSSPIEFTINVPEKEKIDIVTSFVSKFGNDAVKVSIPIKKPVQTIIEAHSALLNSQTDKAALIDSLRKAFVNGDASQLAETEKSIAEMIEDAYPKNWKPKRNDAISLSAGLWLGTDYVEELLKCRNDDGGFGWRQGMNSSAMVTAVVLERISMRKDAFAGSYVEDAVRFLDRHYKDLTMQQYLYVRSLYPEIKCNEILDSAWSKEAKAYLSGKSDKIGNGMILLKARRAVTDMNLGKYKSCIKSDLKSLKQYAVAHPSGGKYFPNAVAYFKGLLENELYAHVKLCELFERAGETELANDIRLWIMVQKETQDWGENPAVADAVNSVRKASDEVLRTKVVSLKSEREIPFEDILSAANGISIETQCISDTAATGDKIKVSYKIKSDENRSFVLLTIPLCAGMTPVKATSGPIRAFTYRNVLSDRIEYWMEVCSEEYTTLTEEFFISQKGDFRMQAPTIECLYAPHYRGNGTSVQKHFSDSLTTNVLPPM